MTLVNIKNSLNRLETQPLKLGHAVIAVLCLFYLRTVLEGILEPPHRIGLSKDAITGLIRLAHDVLSYTTIILSIILITWCCSGARVRLTDFTRLVLYALPVILLPPILDGLFTGGSGYEIRYQKTWDHFLYIYLHSFNPFVSLEGITPGQRIEVFLVCVATAAYVGVKYWSPIRCALTFIAGYSAICFYAFLPAIYVSLVTSLSDVIVPPGWSTADAVLISIGEPAYMIDLRFVLIYSVIASFLAGVWWSIVRYQNQQKLIAEL